MIKKRKYCPHCGSKISDKREGEIVRDYCINCKVFFYDNPLPVASTIIIANRELLLVKRKNNPNKGEWCLPSGFAEIGETIESASLRELEEETGIKGKIIDFVNVDSTYNKDYGDLIFITFESEWMEGKLAAGDDAAEVKFFPFNKLPKLAFSSNTKAVHSYLQNKQEYWAIIDSFSRSIGEKQKNINPPDYLSDKLIHFIEKNAEIISTRWLNDVRTNKTTPTYALVDEKSSLEKNIFVVGQFGKWLGGFYKDKDIRKYYHKIGIERKEEGFALSEILSAISLTRKHIWEFALSQRVWNSAIDIYMTLELERRMMLFFDRASFYVSKGYENNP